MPHHKFTLPEGICICRDVSCTIPYGNCHCGCGIKTAVATQSSTKLGYIIGVHVQWISGHSGTQNRKDFSDAAPFKIDGVYCLLIQLTKNKYVIVYKEDHRFLSQWKWRSHGKTNGFYATRSEQGKHKGERGLIMMHRVILELDEDDNREVDHRNGNTLDNRRSNLRVVSRRQKKLNSKTRKDCKSGFKGVTEHKKWGKFQARITVDGKIKSLGYFSTPESAHAAYCNASHIYHGEYGRTE